MKNVKNIKASILLFVCYFIFSIQNSYNIYADEYLEEELPISVFNEIKGKENKKEFPRVDAKYAIVIDRDSGRIIFEKNAYQKAYIASTTKIITAIVALENGNLNDEVVVSKRASSVGGSNMSLVTGEKIKLEKLLYGLMLRSGNDAAVAIAEHIGGSVENFASMMNEKVNKIGLENSNFRTPHGLDVDGHYSTAYDMAVISRCALNNKIFKEIVGTLQKDIGNRHLVNTNEMLSGYMGSYGIKTGYTGLAGRCLVSVVNRDDLNLICVVLGCESKKSRFESSTKILEYCYNNYRAVTIIDKGQFVGNIKITKGIKSNVKIISNEKIVMPLKEDEEISLRNDLIIPSELEAEIQKNKTVGKIVFYIKDNFLSYSDVVTNEGVERKKFFDFFKNIYVNWIYNISRI